MADSEALIPKHGGYRKLKSFLELERDTSMKSPVSSLEFDSSPLSVRPVPV
jgi:hypothetical protein